jgi:integrase
MAKRTWQAVMDEMATHGIPTTQHRCARGFRSKAYDAIRNKSLVQTTAADLLAIIHANGNCVAHYLRRLHNLALDLGWLAWPILAKRAWPKIRSQSKRAITAEEHAAVIASEKNPERRAYYELLYETGAAQTDAANLTADNIDRTNGILVYRRKKLGPLSEPARLTIGSKLRTLLQSLPRSGDLFPNIKAAAANDRSAEFRRRCRIAGVNGVSLHSYRHPWAQRAKACGYPQRFAQEALGHNSRAVHEAYAKGALVILPPLDEYEQMPTTKVVRLRSVSRNSAFANV